MYTVMQRYAAHKSSGIPLPLEKRVGSGQNSEPWGKVILEQNMFSIFLIVLVVL